MQTGLDVNVKFDSPSSFEFTPELEVFDIFRVPLFHGWLVDPQEQPVADALNGLSYNQVVELVIGATSSPTTEQPLSPTAIDHGLAIDEWLRRNSTQLTYYGIAELHDKLKVQKAREEREGNGEKGKGGRDGRK